MQTTWSALFMLSAKRTLVRSLFSTERVDFGDASTCHALRSLRRVRTAWRIGGQRGRRHSANR